MSDSPRRRGYLAGLIASFIAAALSACKSALDTVQSPSKPEPAPVPVPVPAASNADVVGPVPASKGSARSSAAATPRAYRQDGATHLYGLNAERIYKGKMPPLLYAIGVLNIHIDRAGRVTHLDWMRAPKHAPEVMAEIVRTVQKASPFPAPLKLGKVVYTDTWLWHKSGNFQLDTLTEGQT